MHHPSDQKQHQVCFLQGYQGANGRSEKSLYCLDEETAFFELDVFAEKWDKKYPKTSESWRNGWPQLATYFKYPNEVRKLIYTTNAIEGSNRQLRKVTKSKTVFPSDDSLFKMLYHYEEMDWSQNRLGDRFILSY